MNTMMTSPLGDIAVNSSGMRKLVDALSDALSLLPQEDRDTIMQRHGVTDTLELDVTEAKLLKAACLEVVQKYQTGKYVCGTPDMASPYKVPIEDCTRIENAGHPCDVRCFGGFRECELFAVTQTETAKKDPVVAARIASKIRNVIDKY